MNNVFICFYPSFCFIAFVYSGFSMFLIHLFISTSLYNLKGNCSGKKKIFFIPSIDRVCGNDAQKKISDFLHGSVRRYKTLRSSTNCGCGHLMMHFVGIAITQQFIVVAFT